jgi:predicted phosphoribosyltransferase
LLKQVHRQGPGYERRCFFGRALGFALAFGFFAGFPFTFTFALGFAVVAPTSGSTFSSGRPRRAKTLTFHRLPQAGQSWVQDRGSITGTSTTTVERVPQKGQEMECRSPIDAMGTNITCGEGLARGKMGPAMAFLDRADAGRRLAELLARYRGRDVLVLGIPRGGVPVGAEIATALGGELEVSVARKLGAPGQPELAIGAVSSGSVTINDDVVRALRVPEAFIEAEVRRELAEVARRNKLYRGGRPPPRIAGRTVIVADDGIATGATVRATLESVRREHPEWLVLAVPVAPPRALDDLGSLVDAVVCVEEPENFVAVGQFYRRFPQLEDEHVIEILDRARRG